MSYKHACLLYKQQFGEDFPAHLYNVEDCFATEMIRQSLAYNCTVEIIFPNYF